MDLERENAAKLTFEQVISPIFREGGPWACVFFSV